jgi:hypothetical protein
MRLSVKASCCAAMHDAACLSPLLEALGTESGVQAGIALQRLCNHDVRMSPPSPLPSPPLSSSSSKLSFVCFESIIVERGAKFSPTLDSLLHLIGSLGRWLGPGSAPRRRWGASRTA